MFGKTLQLHPYFVYTYASSWLMGRTELSCAASNVQTERAMLYKNFWHRKSKWVWSGNTKITHRRPTHAPWGRVTEHLQSQNIRKTTKAKQLALSLLLVKMVAKLERTQRNAQTRNQHNRLEAHQTTGQQQQNQHIRTDSSIKPAKWLFRAGLDI